MEIKEIHKELQMTYYELQEYLLEKYGGAMCDYFATPECRSRSKKISRTSEGLYCHHMDEDKGGNLSNPSSALLQPYEWQKKERLVYCNILEHLILHIKIAILRQKKEFKIPKDISSFFTTGGLFEICEDINYMFSCIDASSKWEERCFAEIDNNYEEYVTIISALLLYIERSYGGNKNDEFCLKPGNIIADLDGDYKILKVTKKKDKMLLQTPIGKEINIKTENLLDKLSYLDVLDIVTRKMCSSKDMFYESLYKDILSCKHKNDSNILMNYFQVDYRGYGYHQYADLKLGDEFGSGDADEYISKALPMYSDSNCNLNDKSVVFWKGSKVPLEAQNYFYILRFETMFTIKDVAEPFVRYREMDFLSRGPKNVYKKGDFLNKGYYILSTSDVYDYETKQYYSQYIWEDEVVDAKVVLSLGKDDYLLFKELYDIKYIKILDGCYFC